jgi:chorismate lyase/3-hydroxybenzoate synthase
MIGAPRGLGVDYLSSAELTAHSTAWWDDVLGVVAFEHAPRLALELDVPMAICRTPPLGASADLCEVWRAESHAPAADFGTAAAMSHTSKARRVSYRHDNKMLFGQIAVPEHAFGSGVPPETPPLQLATEIAYQDIFATLKAAGYENLVRIWNFLPGINVEERGSERYRQFNSARQAVFTDNGRAIEGNVPAACALGSSSGSPLSIYFLAARAAPLMIENPRQVSAYHYPPNYGTHSPTFSRACMLPGAHGTSLFISGTASIVGHRTLHPGNVTLQTRESIANIESLLNEANRMAAPARYTLRQLKYKVYVRNTSDLPLIEAELAGRLGQKVCIVFLKADVCREDLLVEIEATGAAS